MAILACLVTLLALCEAIDETTLVNAIDSLENDVASLQLERDQLKDKISNLTSQLDTGVRNLDKSAFSVSLASDTVVSDETIVVFDSVITDNLNNYNPTFGFFECPESGMYFFSLTVVSPEPSAAYLRLGADREIMEITTYTADSTVTGAHTNSVVVDCPQGSTVAVIARAVGGGTAQYTGSKRTFFSGYYI